MEHQEQKTEPVKTGLNVTEWDVTDCSAAIVALVIAQWHVSLQYVKSTVFFYILLWNMLPCFQCCCHWQYNHANAVNKQTWSDDQSWSAAILNFISIFYGRAEQLINNLTLVSKVNMTEVFLYLGSSYQNHFWLVKSQEEPFLVHHKTWWISAQSISLTSSVCLTCTAAVILTKAHTTVALIVRSSAESAAWPKCKMST